MGYTEITEGRSIVVQIIANDKESGVDKVRLYQSLSKEPEEGEAENEEDDNAIMVGVDEAGPFQFHITIPEKAKCDTITFTACAVDNDGFVSGISIERSLKLLKDQPPAASIVKPENNESVVIRGQKIEVFVEAIDDLGWDGIDHIVFFMNDIPVYITYNSYSTITGSFAMEHIFRAEFLPPEGMNGVEIYAIAYDRLGQTGRTQTVTVGQIEDNIPPKLSVLSPPDKEILTQNEAIRLVVEIVDIGVEADRHVYMRMIKEFQDETTGEWLEITQTNEMELFRNDARDENDTTPLSQPEKHIYIYWRDFVNDTILTRSNYRNERIKVLTRTETPNHEVNQETVNEVGLNISEKMYLLPSYVSDINTLDKNPYYTRDIYYSTIGQFKGQKRTGALLASWSIHDPMRFEENLGNAIIPYFQGNISYYPQTGIFIADDTQEALYDSSGVHFVYSDLMAGASEIFWGVISEIHTDKNFIMAAKTGVQLADLIVENNAFPFDLMDDNSDFPDLSDPTDKFSFLKIIKEHWFSSKLTQKILENEDTGRIDTNTMGELLIFTNQNEDYQFGLPYLLSGRVDMPYQTLYGLCRKDDLVFVANGAGGVQVIDISNFKSPYHAGYIKPNGFARDVAVYKHFAVIAASSEGVVIANLLEPGLPVISSFDTEGIANRLFIEGNTLYVVDMAGEGHQSQLTIINLRDPFHPTHIKIVLIQAEREDYHSNGVYDVIVNAGKAYVTVHYSNQEDKSVQSLVEIIDLNLLNDPDRDPSIPVITHKKADEDDFASRGLSIAKNGLYVASGKQGINRIDFPCLSVISHIPAQNAQDVPVTIDTISIEMSQSISHTIDLKNAIRIHELDPFMGLDISDHFDFSYEKQDNILNRKIICLKRKTDFLLMADTKYYVSIDANALIPSSGQTMNSNYSFDFITTPSEDGNKPDIQGIEPSIGSISGNTPIIVYGQNFGNDPKLFVGGQALIIDKIISSDSLNYTQDFIYAKTVPNYAGPASVQVIHENGLSNTVIGAFMYVDILKISFIDPPVVSVSQKGKGNTVEIIGYGFNPSIKIKAWKKGQPETAIINNVDQSWMDSTSHDQNRLILYSAEKLKWVVPDFGHSYRGFVDIEITDDCNRRFLMPDALFYGNLATEKVIETTPPFDFKDIVKYLEQNEDYVLDTDKLPPGNLVDAVSDPALNLLYALGEGILPYKGILKGQVSPEDATSQEYFQHFFAPSWISLLHYERNHLNELSSMQRLAYYNLPQDLVARGIILSDSYLYVSAYGYHFPYIDTEHEDKKLILVYDKIKELPGTNMEDQEPGKERDIRYKLPLNFSYAPDLFAIKDHLMFAANLEDGIAVISISDPSHPSVIRTIKTAYRDERIKTIFPINLHVSGSHLYVFDKGGYQYIFDISKPGMPQTGLTGKSGVAPLINLSIEPYCDQSVVMKNNQAVIARSKNGPLSLELLDVSYPQMIRQKGKYKSYGFSLPGRSVDIFGMTTIAGVLGLHTNKPICEICESCYCEYEEQNFLLLNSFVDKNYISIFDISESDNISLLDAAMIEMKGCRSHLTDDGILLVMDKEKLAVYDILISDLIQSQPYPGETNVPIDQPIALTFNMAIPSPANHTQNELKDYLSSYIELYLVSGSEDGLTVDYNLNVSENKRLIEILPIDTLQANSNYLLKMKEEHRSRRTMGLFNYQIPFQTTSNDHPKPEIISIQPNILSTTGGQITVTVHHADHPVFFVSDQVADCINANTDSLTQYHIQIPADLAGPARLMIKNENGATDEIIGAILYIEPLNMISVEPNYGSINGGAEVFIHGQGFRPGLSQMSIWFGDTPVNDQNIIVLDPQTILIKKTPSGRIGQSDILIALKDGQTACLENAFNYLGPVQSNIMWTLPDKKTSIYDKLLQLLTFVRGDMNYTSFDMNTDSTIPIPVIKEKKYNIYDMAIDSTGIYLVAAAGMDGIFIYNIDPSTFTSKAENPLNPDALRKPIDFNRDNIDDRIIVQVKLPKNYYALGVDTYFENGLDRVFVTAAKAGEEDSGHLFIIGFDSNDMEKKEIISSLPLHSSFARGIDAINNKALLAMADRGIGIVDIHIQSKAYLCDHFQLPQSSPVLDVTRIPGDHEYYAVVSGEFNILANSLINEEKQDSGTFYIVAHHPHQGFDIISQLNVPASRVVIHNHHAYLASGNSGLVIVNISDLTKPEIVSRVHSIGKVYDVDVAANIAYVALGSKGILTIDVTDPENPLIQEGMEAFSHNSIKVVKAGYYSSIGGGDIVNQGTVIQVSPDVVLKVNCHDPQNSILDKDSTDKLRICLRFNKDIHLWNENLNYFRLSDITGNSVPHSITIINNDAIFNILSVKDLKAGDQIIVEALAGISYVKPIKEINVKHFILKQDQQFELTYRGERSNKIEIAAIVPHRVPAGKTQEITISGLGIPDQIEDIRLFISQTEADIVQIQTDATDDQLAIISAKIPAIEMAGQYDLHLSVNTAGLWESTMLYGGIIVDAPIMFEKIQPYWGAFSGGTVVTIFGEGFEPGNSVSESIDVRIGDVPVADINVLASDRMEIITRSGRVGKNSVVGMDRYGNETHLMKNEGFGYGLKRIAQQGVNFNPSDIIIDQETGVAITNGGYYYEYSDMMFQDTSIYKALNYFQELANFSNNYKIPDSIMAATFDIQNPTQPLFVGATSSLPSGIHGNNDIREYFEAFILSRKQHLSLEEQERLDIVKDMLNEIVTFQDSIRIFSVVENENGINKKRLYVACGNGGIAQLNLDDQNSLNILSQNVGASSSGWQTTDIYKYGYNVYSSQVKVKETIPPFFPCTNRETNSVSERIEIINFSVTEDPVYIGTLKDNDGNLITGSNVIDINDNWLYAGGYRGGVMWNLLDKCSLGRMFSGLKPASATEEWIHAIHMNENFQTRHFHFNDNVYDITSYGNYLIVALGNSGIEIFHKERDSNRSIIRFDQELQNNSGKCVRLKRMGNLLFASLSEGGIGVVDISEPMSPYIVSAGNTEDIESVDVYKDRLIAVSHSEGLIAFELPGPLVLNTSVDENKYINENESYRVIFNEPVIRQSLVDNISIICLDTMAEVSIVSISSTEEVDNAFDIYFDRLPELTYEINIKDAANLSNKHLWQPFIGHVRSATKECFRPVIVSVENGFFHKDDPRDIIIKGNGFQNNDKLSVYIDTFPLSPLLISDYTIVINGSDVSGLPLSLGEHSIKIENCEFTSVISGAIIVGESIENVTFTLSPQSGSIKGGQYIYISSDEPAILPGSKIILRSQDGKEIKTGMIKTDTDIYDLRDDVISLSNFRFKLPGVIQPELFSIYLNMSGKDIFIDQFSYQMPSGKNIDLPNYPPMEIGAGLVKDDILFVGIKKGEYPTSTNQFLMTSGFEIYDISIWDRPLRLAQIPTTNSVTGLVICDHLAYMASGRDGLLVVDIHNYQQPYVLSSFPVMDCIATDVTLNKKDGILAMSVAYQDGGGYIRFFDLNNPDLNPPTLLSGINITKMEGIPVDIQWQKNQLFVLLQKSEQLFIGVWTWVDNEWQKTIHPVYHGNLVGYVTISNASFNVSYDQIEITNDHEYLILQANDSGSYSTVYWQDIDLSFSEIINHQGDIFRADKQGMIDTSSNQLVVTEVIPEHASEVTLNETIRIQFNQLINITDDNLYQNIKLKYQSNSLVDRSEYKLTATNTLAGAYVDIQFKDNFTYTGRLYIEINKAFLNLEGHSLINTLKVDYTIVEGERPVFDTVVRETLQGNGNHFFHCDGTETAIINGKGFGSRINDIVVKIGDITLSQSQFIGQLSDIQMKVKIPAIQLKNNTAAISVSVSRKDVHSVLYGAIIVQPKVSLQEITPDKGLPQGGNDIHLYGSGFHNGMKVTMGQTTTVYYQLINSHHIKLKVPSGSIGYADVSVESMMFPGEKCVLPSAYFYASKSISSLEISDSGSDSGSDSTYNNGEAVTALAIKDQLLFILTGGRYQAVNKKGQIIVEKVQSTGKLMLIDISNPLEMDIITKEEADKEQPYFLKETLYPDGFKDITLEGNALYIIGGSSLFYCDITIPSDPLLIEKIDLLSTTHDLVVKDDIVYVTTDHAIHILKKQDEEIREIASIPNYHLGGSLEQISIEKDTLWVSLPEASKILAIELNTGKYFIVNQIDVKDMDGNIFTPSSLLMHNNLLLISGGKTGNIVAYEIQPNHQSIPVGQFILLQLSSTGNLFAGKMALRGHLLYIAAGDGDLQVFDISNWLNGDFRSSVPQKNYYNATGSISTFVHQRNTLVAGTAFVYIDKTPAENLFAGNQYPTGLGGDVNIFEDNHFNMIETSPSPGSILPCDWPVEIQFNQILNTTLYYELEPEWITIQKCNQDAIYTVEGITSFQTNENGTKMILRPRTPFEPNTEYRLKISSQIEDLNGQTLENDYRFSFFAEMGQFPEITAISPQMGSYRGGDKITLYGENFSSKTRIEIAGIDVSPCEVFENYLSFYLPELAEKPVNNQWVGISLSNGQLKSFKAACFLYMTDPQIYGIGQYDPENNSINFNDHTVDYNSGSYISVTGKGFSTQTRVLINNKPAQNVELIGPQMIRFRMPDNTLNQLSISLSNLESGNDTVVNNNMNVVLSPVCHFSNNIVMLCRSGDLLMIADNFNPETNSTVLKLYSTRDSTIPVLLSTIKTNQQIHSIAMSGIYAVVCCGSRFELNIYDIRNSYAPRFIHTITNPNVTIHKKLIVSGETFISQGINAVFGGNVHGESWETISNSQSPIDIDCNDSDLFILYPQSIERRPLNYLHHSTSHKHQVAVPEHLYANPQRLLVFGGRQLEIFCSGNNRESNTIVSLGTKKFNSPMIAAVNGDLLGVFTEIDLNLYDIDMDSKSSDLQLKHLGTMYHTYFQFDKKKMNLCFQGKLLEWIVSNKEYSNIEIPIVNTIGIHPKQYMGNANGQINIDISGNPDDFKTVMLNVQDEQMNILSGNTRLHGKALQFTPIGSLYDLNALYKITLYNNPISSIDGISVNIDLPWYLETPSDFSMVPLEIYSLSPQLALSSINTSFTINGLSLHNAQQLFFNDQQILPENWVIHDNGTRLSFETNINQPGIYSLSLSDHNRTESIPAALLVVKPMSINHVVTNSLMGNNKIGESGETIVRMMGEGLSGGIQVYMVENNAGFSPDETNQIKDLCHLYNEIQFTAPSASKDVSYEIILHRITTNEMVKAPVLLYGIDDVKPSIMGIQTLSYNTGVQLKFDEMINTNGFNVICTNAETIHYTNNDVSQFFELKVTDNILRLNPKIGYSLALNKIFTINIHQIKDLSANTANDYTIRGENNGQLLSGSYIQTFKTKDTISPKHLELWLESEDNETENN